ncbi:MAG: hypothetical protein AAFO94_09900 [Bacteroidota bacterium]
MKTKLVLWGSNEKDEKVLIAIQLRAKDNAVDIWTFPESVATEEFYQLMLDEWRNGKEVDLPEERSHMERELTISEGLLPDSLKVERGDIVQRALTEWHFVVLSSKLNEVYQSELSEFKEKIEQLSAFDNEVWNGLKTFWSKVQTQVRDRNLFREHANSLRENTNVLFAKLKELRSALDDEFKTRSKKHYDGFMETLQDIETRVSDGGRLGSIFNELKDLQRKFRDTKFTKEHRSAIWEKLDGAFKSVKEKQYGPNANVDSSPYERLKRRYEGLLGAIEKMQRSIGRDRDDLAFQGRKIARSDGQLEAQIRQAKVKMIEERISSKEEKLGEMNKTRTDLEKRLEVEKVREAKRAEQAKIKEAEQEAKAKIAARIKEQEAAREEKSDDLEKAAAAMQEKKQEKAAAEVDQVINTVTETVEHTVEDVVDTIKAVAEVVENKIGKVVKALKEDEVKVEAKQEEEE